LDGETLPVDYGANAGSLGHIIKVTNKDELEVSSESSSDDRTVCIVVETDRRELLVVTSRGDVAVAEVFGKPSGARGTKRFRTSQTKEQHYL